MQFFLPQNGVALSFYMATKVQTLLVKNVAFQYTSKIGQKYHLSELIQLPED